MFRSPSISLHFLAITTCLLGGCEKREAAPAAEREHRSSARSGISDFEGKSRAGTNRGENRGERTTTRDVLQAIRLLSQADFSEESGSGGDADYDALIRAEEAIREADPAQFDAIMEEIGNLEDEITRENLQALAILHLVAGQDLLRAGEVVLERFPPGGDRRGVLNSLVTGSDPTATAALDFWRSLPEEERGEVADLVFLYAAVDMGSHGLAKWKDEGYRLSDEETIQMMRVMALSHINTSPLLLPVDGPSEYPDLIGAIAPLEKEGVLSKGAADELMLQYLTHQQELGGEPVEFLGMPGTQAKVEELRKDGFDSLYSRVAAERPHRFFTDTGIHDLPMEKITVAWTGWLEADPAAAREWFGKYGPPLESAGRDYIQAGFASHALGEGNAEAARKWGSQIADPELRAKTLSGLPE